MTDEDGRESGAGVARRSCKAAGTAMGNVRNFVKDSAGSQNSCDSSSVQLTLMVLRDTLKQ